MAREREEARVAAEAAERRRRAERKKRTEARAAGPGRPKLEEVEAAIIEREERLEEIAEEMGRESVYRNADLMRGLARERESIEAELADLEARWSELTE
jgi:hypothetical protein